MSKLEYCDERHDYFVDDWKAEVILGAKALLQKKEGKKIVHATLTGGRITEQKVGATQDCGGPFTATSKGWKLNE